MRKGFNPRERVSFERSTRDADDYGGTEQTWAPVFGPVSAEFRFDRSREAEQAGALTGITAFKVRIRESVAAKSLDASCRMTDVRAGVVYNVRGVDAITDPAFVWLSVESGVAV